MNVLLMLVFSGNYKFETGLFRRMRTPQGASEEEVNRDFPPSPSREHERF